MARTSLAMAPVQSHFGAPPEFHPMTEQSAMDFIMRTDRAVARSAPRAMYPGLQAPGLDASKSLDALPMVLNRPRKLSASSTSTNASRESIGSRLSSESRTRRSSWSSKTSLESLENLTSQSWRPEYLYSRPNPPTRKPTRQYRAPGELFAALPGEVLELILDDLKKLHLNRGSESCATCLMRDFGSIALSSRKWYKFARTSLYEDIQLIGADSAAHRKKYKLAHGTRLVLLRRTLRSNLQIAPIVRSLKVPAVPAGVPVEEYHNLVASVVMACPNLERLVGMYPTYDHTFSRLFYALSTRPRLKDMVWMLGPPSVQRHHRIRSASGSRSSLMLPLDNNAPPVAPMTLQPHHGAAFVDFHVDWRYLTTLVIHCHPGATLAPNTLISTTLAFLPALQTLHLSHLPAAAFNDSNLTSLPQLKKLSMSHMPGISSAGLSALATTLTSSSLESLTLRHANVDLLPALARLLSNSVRLTSFALVQAVAPVLPDDTFIWLMPYLASGSLRRLHWDVTGGNSSNSSSSSAADSLLARSIGAGGFPALRTLRVPHDPAGIFQALCRPLERADLPSDRYRGLGPNSYGGAAGATTASGSSGGFYGLGLGLGRPATPSSPTKMPGGTNGAAGPKTPTSPRFPLDPFAEVTARASPPRECSDLHQARMAAQARLEAARGLPRFFVNVVDEDGTLCEKYGLAGFLGAVESRITYHLLPDAGATDQAGGLVTVPMLLTDGGEDFGAAGRAGCCGRWNGEGRSADRRERERWWHTERGRWTALELS